jgi:hypothetical protein
MKKAKAEQFIDFVQNALILGRRTRGRTTTAVWSVLYDLEQASHAAVYIPDSLSAEDAAREFVQFLAEMESREYDPKKTPAWLHGFVMAEIETSASTNR